MSNDLMQDPQVNDLVICSMHIVDGFKDSFHEQHGKLDPILQKNNLGRLEFIEHLSNFAPYCSDKFRTNYDKYQDCPGVFDYEVSAAFGGWFADELITTRVLPSHEECLAKIDSLSESFWKDFEEETEGMIP